MTTPAAFWVDGVPVAQGSMKVVPAGGKRGGRPIVIHSNDQELKAWRDVIAVTAKQVVKKPMVKGTTVRATFYLPRPKRMAKTKWVPHLVRPDVDKLIRALLDALTDIAFPDDSYVTRIDIEKRYPEPGGKTGVAVRLYPTPAEIVAWAD